MFSNLNSILWHIQEIIFIVSGKKFRDIVIEVKRASNDIFYRNNELKKKKKFKLKLIFYGNGFTGYDNERMTIDRLYNRT